MTMNNVSHTLYLILIVNIIVHKKCAFVCGGDSNNSIISQVKLKTIQLSICCISVKSAIEKGKRKDCWDRHQVSGYGV